MASHHAPASDGEASAPAESKAKPARVWNRTGCDTSQTSGSSITSLEVRPGVRAMYEVGASGGEAVMDLAGTDPFDEKELLEFLAADIDPVPSDPVFRERLREELWEMVLAESAERGKDR